jgi:hypothetical protein
MRLNQAQLARIQTLEGRDGRISARKVFEDAKQRSSPLHSLYDWNAKHAAEKWWLHHTRLIIASVTIQVTVNNAVLKTPHYIVDTSVKGGGYRSTIALKGDSPSARESLIYTLEVAAGHLRRAYDLAQPLGLTKEIDYLLAQIAGVKRIVMKENAA